MKKTLLIVAVIAVSVLSLGLAGYAYAQTQTPEYPYDSGMMGNNDGYGRGMMSGYSDHGMMGGYGDYGMMGWNGKEGPMHDAMVTEVANALGLTPEEIEARHDGGESIWEIAESEGLGTEEIQNLMDSAHDLALEDAVAKGYLTQEEAEWMNSHMETMWEGDNHCGKQNGSGFGSHRGGMNWER
jgi:hypothetical protein